MRIGARTVVMRIGFRQDNLDLAHRDHGEEPDEEQKERSKDPEGSDKRPNIHPSGGEKSPRRRKKVAVQAADNDDETLEPHAGVDAHADKINDVNITAAPAE